MFWFLASLVTLVVLLAVVWPLLRKPAALPARAEHDVEVYGAQLRELDADLARGAIAGTDLASARTEINRRLLKAVSGDPIADARPAGVLGMPAMIAACVVAGATVVAALPIYAVSGRPDQPDMPLVARLTQDPSTADVSVLIAQAETRLRENPRDERGWDALLPLYLQFGRTEDALRAADEAIRLLGSTASREILRGEARLQAASGEVSDAAKESFETALRLDPGNGSARFYLALRFAQKGDLERAGAGWREIIDQGRADAQTIEASRVALAATSRRLTEARNAPRGEPAPGPSLADIESASRLSDADRKAMVQGMVAQLAARLDSAPNDLDGWKRLVRSYAILGDVDDARAAHRKARGIFSDGSPERRSIDEFAATLGLGDGKAVQ